MDILKFIRWQWNRGSTTEKLLTAFIIWILIIPINVYFMTAAISFAIFFIGVILAGVFALLYQLGCSIMKQWRYFQKEREHEAEQIMARLRGSGQ